MSDESIVHELAWDLGFGAPEAARLAEASEAVEGHIGQVSDRFYAILGANPRLKSVFDDEAQIARQKVHLGEWLRGLFCGRYDDEYWSVRARIGRTHVRIGLDQRYMVSMMGVLRTELDDALRAAGEGSGWGPERIGTTRRALDRLLDLELAVMLETYQEAFMRRVRSGERLATIGQVAATIGHELRNPLAVIDSSLAILRRRLPDDPRVGKHLERIGGQVKVADATISNLLAMVRDRPPVRSHVDLRELIVEIWDSLRGAEGVELRLELAEPRAYVDPAHARQLLTNLLQNALQAEATAIVVGTEAIGDTLELVVEDDGRGLPEGAEAWLFEPLATARQGGSGLGLALCRRIVDKHDGSIVAERLERGTRLRARLAGAIAAEVDP